MISGEVNAYCEAVVRLPVRSLQGREQAIEAVSAVTFDIHEAVILWDGRLRRISVDAADTEPLLGMRLLYGHDLNVRVVEGGIAVIKPFPLF